MDKLASMRVFACVVEKGSFANAAAHLDMSTSSVSRYVADLEAALNTRLLHRTTRRLSLTESGSAYFERCAQILQDVDDAELLAASQTTQPRGTLKISCSFAFGIRHLAPCIGQFQQLHPEVRFDVVLSDRFVDLIEEGFDLAIRIGNIGDSPLVARKIGATQMITFASPRYLAEHGTPTHPRELSAHNCFLYSYLAQPGTWAYRDARGQAIAVKTSGNVHANSGELLAAIAAEGGGISIEPDFIVAPAVRAGSIVPILGEFAPDPLPIYAVYPSRKHLSAKVRAFIDFLATKFAAKKDWSY